MIIHSLKLSNYRRFESLYLEFPQNIIGVIGRNGSGKSTLFEAIGWALYGNRFVRTDKVQVRSVNVDEKTPCSAELYFSVGGSEYRIVRSLKGKNAVGEAAIYRDGGSEPVAVQDRGVNEFVENLLQLDYRSFTSSVFAQQKELDKLTTLQPEQRRQAINRLLNIDRIDRAREEVRRQRNDKKNFIEGRRSALRDEGELKAQKKVLREEEKAKRNKQKQLADKLAAAEEKAQKIKKEFEAALQLRDKHMSLDAQLGQLASRIEENKTSLARLHDELAAITNAEEELQQVQASLSDFSKIAKEKERFDELREKSIKLAGRKSELELVRRAIEHETAKLVAEEEKVSNLKELERSAEQVTSRVEQLEQDRNAAEKEINKVHGLKVSAEQRGLELKEKLQTLKELGPDGECPVCTQKLADHYDDVIADHDKQLAALRDAFKQYRSHEETARSRKKEIEAALIAARREKESALKKLQTAQQAQERVSQIEKHLGDYREQEKLTLAGIEALGPVDYDENEHKQINKKHEKMLALQQRSAKLEERVGRRTDVESQIALLQKTIAALNAELASTKEEQAALGFSETEYKKLKSALEEANTHLRRMQDELATAAQQLALLQRDIASIDKELDEQKKLRKEIEQIEEEIVYLNALDENFGHFRLELAGRIRPLIAQRASELLALTTSSRYSQIDLDADYNITIYDGAAAYAIQRFSGGEQDLANLCLRIAISQVVAERSGGTPVNFIVLDEIFGSQDMDRRELILNALGRLASQFRQIFVITHIDAVRDGLPVLLQVEQIDQYKSKVTLI